MITFETFFHPIHLISSYKSNQIELALIGNCQKFPPFNIKCNLFLGETLTTSKGVIWKSNGKLLFKKWNFKYVYKMKLSWNEHFNMLPWHFPRTRARQIFHIYYFFFHEHYAQFWAPRSGGGGRELGGLRNQMEFNSDVTSVCLTAAPQRQSNLPNMGDRNK